MKKTRMFLVCLLLFVLAPALGAGVLTASPDVGDAAFGTVVETHSQPGGGFYELQQIALEVWAALPDRQTIEAKDFSARFPALTASKLEKAGITSITRNGNHIEMALPKEYQHQFPKVAVKIAPHIAFDVLQSQNGLEVHNIEGLKVYVSWFFGWMDIKDLSFQRQPNGNTVVNAQVCVWFKPGKVGYKVTVGPDGKVLH